MNIHPKVAAASITGTIVALVLSLLVAYVPAFHNGVPLVDQQLITAGITVILSFVAGYLKKSPPVFTAGNLVEHVQAVKAGVAGHSNELDRAAVLLTASKTIGQGPNVYG